jgi:hypothetical protein
MDERRRRTFVVAAVAEAMCNCLMYDESYTRADARRTNFQGWTVLVADPEQGGAGQRCEGVVLDDREFDLAWRVACSWERGDV